MLASEYMKQLESDPKWRAQQQENERIHQARVEAGKIIREPVNQELRALGFTADSYLEIPFGETPFAYFPVFAHHLELDDLYVPDFEISGTKEVFDEMNTIAFRFFQRDANVYWDLLLDRFNFTKDKPERKSYRDSLIQALTYTTSTPNQQLKMIDMLLDPTEGDCRLLMLDWLKQTYHPTFQKVFEILVEKDPVMRTKILSWKPYWKKHNPDLLEKWGKVKSKK